ncbi:MAG: hypothetical protein CVU05_14070 [Bacteroidetes bacterium HGW-Bacteroidetes-21]|nr:MAG: hypothetical protein CVU05_14070 [Bacteroidetes bacterium HGW-Bacteroidetes-21]
MKHLKDKIRPRLEKLGKEVFGNADADETINNISAFFTQINCPVTITPFCPSFNKKEYLELMVKNKVSGMNHKLDPNDLEKIVSYMHIP